MRFPAILFLPAFSGVAGSASGSDRLRGVFDLSDDPGPSPSQVRPNGLPDAPHRGGDAGAFPGGSLDMGAHGGAGVPGS